MWEEETCAGNGIVQSCSGCRGRDGLGLSLAFAHCLWEDAQLELGPTVWADRTFLQRGEPEALSFCPAQGPGGL